MRARGEARTQRRSAIHPVVVGRWRKGSRVSTIGYLRASGLISTLTFARRSERKASMTRDLFCSAIP